MERGNYSDAVRRITTAIEVIVEAATVDLVERDAGRQVALTFLNQTSTNFPRRVEKYEQLSGRAFPPVHRTDLAKTRKLRHRIVHEGYRIGPGERGNAQRSVDTGRWIFDWFENDQHRKQVRDSRLAQRSFGRNQAFGIFRPEITPDGVVLSSFRDRLTAPEDRDWKPMGSDA